MSVKYAAKSAVKVQADGAVEVNSTTKPGILTATTHQVSVQAEATATGTVAIEVKYSGHTAFTPLLNDSDAAVVFNLASPVSPYVFTSLIEAVRFVPTSVTVGYHANAFGWH